jgi:hypothetical protein
MNKAIEILQSQELMLDTEYEIKSDELRLAKKYGSKKEVEELGNDLALIWARLSMVIKLIEKLQAERVEA